MNVLISQLGVADPIQNGLDGAMLHIFRHNPVDKVILFDTGATKYQKEDFLQAMNSVREISKAKVKFHQFHKVNEERFNPASFQHAEQVIMGILIELLNSISSEDTVYLNLSSGTPALTAVAYSVGQIYPNTKMVQVLLPKRNEHIRNSDQNNEPTSIEALIEHNADNLESAQNRCVIVEPNSILRPLADVYVNGGFITKVLLCEGQSDVNYVNTILKEHRINDVLAVPSGGSTGILQNARIFSEKVSNVFALFDGDTREQIPGQLAEVKQILGDDCVFVLRRQVIEEYVKNGNLGKRAKGLVKQMGEAFGTAKSVKSKKKIQLSEMASIKNLRELEEELLAAISFEVQHLVEVV